MKSAVISHKRSLGVLLIFIILTMLFFHPFFLKGKIPFPSNLLVSTYSPWKYMKHDGQFYKAANKAMGFDTIRQAYINREYMSKELRAGRFPLWNPYIFSGMPFMAVFDPAIFYPLNAVFLLFPAIDAWNILVIVQPVLTALFMYLFLSSLSLPIAGALFGSIVFAFSGWMIVYWEEALIVEHSILWLPLALFASNRIWKGKSAAAGFLLLVFSLASSILAGFLQTTLYVFIVSALWNVYLYAKHRETDSGKRMIACAGAFFLSVAMACIQLFPSFELYSLSPRGVVDSSFVFRDFLVPIQHLMTFLAPDYWGNPGAYNYFGKPGFYYEKVLYIGILPLLLALYAVFIKTKELRFFTWFTFVTLSMGFALPTGWLLYFSGIPVLSSSLPTRIFILAVFGLSVLSAYGFSEIMNTIRIRRVMAIASVCAIAFLLMGAYAGFMWLMQNRYAQVLAYCNPPPNQLLSQACTLLHIRNFKQTGIPYDMYATVSLRNLVLPAVFFGLSLMVLFLRSWSRNAYVVLGFGLTILSGFYFANKYLYYSEKEYVYPHAQVIEKLKNTAGYQRTWEYGNAYIEKNIPMHFGLYSPDGYNGMYPQHYGELVSVIQSEGSLSARITRSDADLKPASEKEPLGSNPYRLRLMSLLGVKYILETKLGDDKDHKTTAERFTEDLFIPVWDGDDWRIWEYRNALPRAYAVTSAEVVYGKKQILERLFSPDFDFRNFVIIDREPAIPLNGCDNRENNTVSIQRYESGSVGLASDTACPSLVVLSDSYFPGWEAYVDGKKTEILRANYSLRAVAVPDGKHTVTFRYNPVTFRVGAFISLAGVLVSLVFFGYLKRTGSRRKS